MKKQILPGIALSIVAILSANCNQKSDDNNDELLALLLLNQQGRVTFTKVSNPGFTLRTGEEAFYNPGPWGEAETKANQKDIERETAIEATITLTNGTGYAYFTANAEKDLTIQGAFGFMRLEQGGIRSVLAEKPSNPADFLPSGNVSADNKPIQAAKFALIPNKKKTFCLEFHRKFKGPKTNGKYEVEAHVIAWDKPCVQLTDSEKANYTWDIEDEIIEDIELSNATLISGLQAAAGVGYVTKDASVTVKPFKKKFGTAGSLR